MTTYVGIDVAKHGFDLAFEPKQKILHFDNDAKAIQRCRKLMKQLKPERIVMEPTGGYAATLAAKLQDADLPVAVVNARNIRQFARASGKLAKTDKLDAQVIAHFAAVLQPPVQEPLDQRTRTMKALVARRHQLVQMHTAEINRTEHAHDHAIQQSLRTVLKALENEIDNVERQISERIEQTPELRRKTEQLVSTPGIGETTAALLVTELPELAA